MKTSSSIGRSALLIAVVATSAASFALAAWLAQTAWFRHHDGTWHVRAVKASGLLLPAAILLFALGVEWALRKRWSLAVPALLPLCAWVVSLHRVGIETRDDGAAGVLSNLNILVNDCWMAIIMMQMQGLRPFGAA